MKNIFVLILVIAFSIVSSTSNAQEEKVPKRSLPIKILIKQKSDRALIRWAFDDPNAWYINKDMGFDIYRADLADGTNKKYVPIAKNVKVADQSTLESKFAEDESNIGVAAIYQANYGQWESQGENSAQYGILDKKDELDTKYLTLLYSCDIDWNTALLAGMAYEDKTTQNGINYIYRLVPSNPMYGVKHAFAEKADETPIVISEKIENENQIVLGWNRLVYDNRFSGYFIEKSKDGRSYKSMNDLPYVHLLTEDINDIANILWSDSLSNYDPYYYRVIGIDAFGEKSTPSDPVRLRGRDRTPPIAPDATVALDEDQQHVTINWDLEMQNDVSKVVIQKGNKSKFGFADLAEVAKIVNEYKDDEVEIVSKTYYRVCAVDTAQNYACTEPKYLVLDDKIAPDAPQNLVGKIDTNGIVTLNWEMGSEKDLMGYYIQVSNGTSRVFTSLTPTHVSINAWQDSIPLNVLTEDIYYRVNAVDLRSNTSDFSQIIKLEKPDIVPPNASIFTGYKVLSTSVNISFVASSSKDVETITLQRKSGNIDFQDLTTITTEQQLYNDINVTSNTQYTYRLVTMDDAGNTTYSPINIIITTKNINVNSDVNLTLTSQEENQILTWSHNGATPDYIKIYKGELKNLKPLKTLRSDVSEFKINPKEGEKYRVRIFFADGAKSAYSNAVSL